MQAQLLFLPNFPQELRATIDSDLTRPQHLQGVRPLVQLLVKGLEAPAFERLARVAGMPIAAILDLRLAQEIPELNGLHGLFQDRIIHALVDADRWEEVAAFCYLIGRSRDAVKAWMKTARKAEVIRSTSRLATVRNCHVILHLMDAFSRAVADVVAPGTSLRRSSLRWTMCALNWRHCAHSARICPSQIAK